MPAGVARGQGDQRLAGQVEDLAPHLAFHPRPGVELERQAQRPGEGLERDAELSLRANQQELLFQTEKALGRLADGSYGQCADCGVEIPSAMSRL